MSAIKTDNKAGAAANNTALSVVKVKMERLIVDEMGSQMVSVVVGKDKVPFSVHKNLIMATSATFAQVFGVSLKATEQITFTPDQPAAFKLFVEYLYTKRIPTVLPNATLGAQSTRLRDLCQLSAFADRYTLKNEIRNHIMDAIQDGFVTVGKFAEPPLIKAIFINTQPGSKLRDFSMASLFYGLRSGKFQDEAGLRDLIKSIDDALTDFIKIVRMFASTDKDPRIRDCGGEAGCVECAAPGRAERKVGTWPCQFHVHTTVGSDGVETMDPNCYLWE